MRSRLPDIFLSYSRDDQTTARRFAEGFERAGFTVWWDATLDAGQAYDEVTEKALQEASAVVVLWSKKSVASRWVRAEATQAIENRTLVPVMIEACKRPIMFELTQTADLSHWTGEVSDKAWQSYLAGLRRFVEKGSLGAQLPAEVSQIRARLPDTSSTGDSAVERAPSIAVLPFANLSGDKEQEYFSDGLAEEIINSLAQIAGLKVIARTSAFVFRGQNTDIRRIAETLGVANVLEGSVRRSGNRIRVTVQLITASDGSHLWSERYDRELADVFAVQDEISAAISEALKIKLSPQAAAKPRHTPSLPAYEALLKARHFHWKITPKSMDQAKLFHEQAIALDPQYALAHALYAEHLLGRAAMGYSPLRELAPAIRTLAQRALELDPSIVEAHGVLCSLAATYDYDWHEAWRQCALAMPGGRGSPQVHFNCGLFYSLGSGRREEAVEQLKLAVQADPLNLMYRASLAVCLGAVGQYDEAEELLYQSRDLDPNFIAIHLNLVLSQIARQKFAEALPFAEKAFSLAPWLASCVGLYAGLLVRTGEPDRGREIVRALGAGESYGASKGLAGFHSLCGDIDAAADWYERAIEERDPIIPYLLQGALGEPLRASPHWPRLAALMNLPAALKTLAT
jgi:TolB-like protein/Tfp pilus assembly protein PilF